jgi:hypothetical protein
MIEYAILSMQNFSLSITAGSSETIVYFLFGGIIAATIGYWIKKWIGVTILIGVLLFYLYNTGFFGRLFG